jgi:uncharacterized protein (TIGR02453 family)
MSKKALAFLKELANNNDREWFKNNKPIYDDALEDVKKQANYVRKELDKYDLIESHTVYRIYRDIRFSKDKSPFKDYLTAGYQRATNQLRGGYYLEVSPGKSFVGGGFWSPSAHDLKRIREEFAADSKTIKTIVNNKTFLKYFGAIKGDELKTSPRGFDASTPNIELIRKKQFLLLRYFKDDEVTKANFKDEAVKTFLAMRPFLDYMSMILTTDANGETIVG